VTRRADLPLVLASARVAVGVLLMAAPELPLPRDDTPNGTSAFLMRTIGIRDLVLGGGAVVAVMRGRRDEFARWAAAGLASDAGDLIAGLGSAKMLGRGGSAKAVAVVAPWVFAGAVGLGRRRG
jgi:hypothetical protein